MDFIASMTDHIDTK